MSAVQQQQTSPDGGTATSPSAQQNPLSCETCRRRKTKCDRSLPSCGHCVDAKVACHYPQARQRGPQVGYLSLLESRLVATETALFDVLSKVSYTGSDNANDPTPATSDKVVKQLQERYSNMPYSAKTAEWNQQPLQTDSDLQRWWLERRRLLMDTQQDQRANEVATMATPVRVAAAQDPPRDPHKRSLSRSSPQPEATAQIDPELVAELSEEQMRKYF